MKIKGLHNLILDNIIFFIVFFGQINFNRRIKFKENYIEDTSNQITTQVFMIYFDTLNEKASQVFHVKVNGKK